MLLKLVTVKQHGIRGSNDIWLKARHLVVVTNSCNAQGCNYRGERDCRICVKWKVIEAVMHKPFQDENNVDLSCMFIHSYQ